MKMADLVNAVIFMTVNGIHCKEISHVDLIPVKDVDSFVLQPGIAVGAPLLLLQEYDKETAHSRHA